MPIPEFENLSEEEQQTYIAELVQRARDVLYEDGEFDLASKVQALFERTMPEGSNTLGVAEVEFSIDIMRRDDAWAAKKNPKALPRDVEEAMFVTLEKNHIDLPERFFTVPRAPEPKPKWRRPNIIIN